MHASVFATIFWTALEATALKALAWIAVLVMLILIESLADRIASSHDRSGHRSARPSRGGGLVDRHLDESLAGMGKDFAPFRR